MDITNDPVRKRIIAQRASANTLAEMKAASEAVKQWRREHPEDWAIIDGGEIFSHQMEYAEWKLANPEEWQAQQEEEQRAISALEPERGQMLRGARQARTLAQLDRAEQELFQWAADHPEDVGRDLGIIEVLESVLTRREAVEAQPEPMLAGRAA